MPEGLLTARDRFFTALDEAHAKGALVRLMLAGARGTEPDLRRVLARPLVMQGRACLSLTWQHRTRDVTKNLPFEEAAATLRALLDEGRFANAHLIARDGELQLAISRKGKASLRRGPTATPALDAAGAPASDAIAASSHDRVKHRHVGLAAPWLHALGITDAQGRLVPAMARKYKQIDKFVEVLDDALDAWPDLGEPADRARPLTVLDFGAGKGYLTFAVHDHLRRRFPGRPVQVIGVDLKDDMVALGNDTAQRLGLQPTVAQASQPGASAVLQAEPSFLAFERGDVRHHPAQAVDIMIALHACDTATDFAMHKGVRAGAALILCAPCCHKELRPQLRSPAPLGPLLRHGIHRTEQAEMLTDGLRALLLEAEGYDTKVFEFTSLEHTSKNKMILATRRAHPKPAQPIREQIRQLKEFYGATEQCLETLLARDRTAR